MKYNLNFEINASSLVFPVTDAIAKDIYYELINSKEALEVAEEIRAEADEPEKIVLEDILWDIAYYNAENIRIQVSQVINIELRKK